MNKKQLVSLLLSAVLVLSLAACGGGTTPPASSTPPASTSTPASSSEPAPEPAPEPEGPTYEPATVRVAYMPNLGSAGSLFVGMDQGYFEEVGLTVRVYEVPAGPAEIARSEEHTS